MEKEQQTDWNLRGPGNVGIGRPDLVPGFGEKPVWVVEPRRVNQFDVGGFQRFDLQSISPSFSFAFQPGAADQERLGDAVGLRLDGVFEADAEARAVATECWVRLRLACTRPLGSPALLFCSWPPLIPISIPSNKYSPS
jgi:hypothetical protein